MCQTPSKCVLCVRTHVILRQACETGVTVTTTLLRLTDEHRELTEGTLGARLVQLKSSRAPLFRGQGGCHQSTHIQQPCHGVTTR